MILNMENYKCNLFYNLSFHSDLFCHPLLFCHSDPELKRRGRIPKGDPSAMPQGDTKGHSEHSIQSIPCHSERSDSGVKNLILSFNRNEILRLRLRMTKEITQVTNGELRIKKGKAQDDKGDGLR
jgi:hypothetical protein